MPNEMALWKIQDLIARYATPLPIKFGKAETKYNVVIRFLGVCGDSGMRVIGLPEFQRKRREQVKSLLIQGGYKNRFEMAVKT